MSTDPHARLAARRACWHPVAYAADVARAPRATTLLGEPLVLWREAQDALHAFRDVCVHRGTALSLGCVEGDEIVCAYHGWRYRGDGACMAIPQLAEPARVPARARALAYPTQERYGIVWVALEPPRWPLPDVPELDDPAWRTVRAGPFAWACDASRQVENFTDFGHFAFVHAGLLGDPGERRGGAARGARRRPCLDVRVRAAGRAQHRRVPGVHRRGSQGLDAAHALRAPPAVHDRRAHRLGRRRRPGVFLRVPARRRTTSASATAWSPATTTSSSRTT